ncbi:hypothetical protein [Dokdonia sp.]|uniref:hypothetical protein n=1 Tax=Dokdonia sp. TaxID=2024995 RepID=UPI0032657916
MKINEEKIVDQLVSKAIQSVDVKAPSVDFTQTLMDKIQTEQATQTVIVYEPLISRRMWSFLIAIIGGLIGYVSIQNIGLTTISSALRDVSTKIPTWELPSFNVPNVDMSVATTSPFVYGTLTLAGFLVIEILILKRKYKW